MSNSSCFYCYHLVFVCLPRAAVLTSKQIVREVKLRCNSEHSEPCLYSVVFPAINPIRTRDRSLVRRDSEPESEPGYLAGAGVFGRSRGIWLEPEPSLWLGTGSIFNFSLIIHAHCIICRVNNPFRDFF